MDTAFQADAFQNDAFQISGVVPPTVEGGGPGKFGKPRRLRAKPPEPEKENEDWIVLIL